MSKSPAFQFYPSDFLSDRNTALMTTQELGAYTLLMCYCWREGSLHDDLEEMALLCRMDEESFKSSWEKRISSCFTMNDHGEWVHPRLEKEREKQQSYKEKKAEAGRKGAESRWGKGDSSTEMAENGTAKNHHGTANDVPMANDGSSSLSSTSSSDTKPYTGEFEDFWEMYGIKKGKKKAWLEWKKLTEADKSKLMENVPIFLTHFSSEQYTPRPRKYLYNRYWEDEDYQKTVKQHHYEQNGNKRGNESRTDRFHETAEELVGGSPG